MNKELNAAEAVYGFVGWLTSREERTVMSAKDDCAPIAELIKRFCTENNLPEVSDQWPLNLIHPSGEVAVPNAEASRLGSPELQAMIIARCVEKDQADGGFDYKTAADFLSGKTVSDEALRKFVAASRGAHDARAALHAKTLSLQGELASSEAEIALLKRSLLDAEAAPQPPSPQADSVLEDAALWHWLAEYLVGTRTDLDDEIVACETVNDLRKLVEAAIKQGATK